MKRLISLTTMIATVSIFTASTTLSAQDTQPSVQAQVAPATQPASATLPEGHPQLPQGHPQLPQDHPQLPQGHPEIAKQSEGPPVYETTEIEPAWNVAVRHLIVQPMGPRLHVTEVWSVHNPTNQSYIGTPVLPPTKQADEAQSNDAGSLDRVTLVLPLPAGATQVQPGPEFHTCCVRVEGDKLISKMPMLPGTSEFRVDYLLLAEDGTFNLSLATPASTDHVMVFLPDDGTQVTAQGLMTGDSFEANGQKYRMYTAKQVEPGADTGLVIQVSDAALEAAAGAMAPTSQAGTIKLIAGGGAGVLVLAGTFVLLKPTKRTAPAGATA